MRLRAGSRWPRRPYKNEEGAGVRIYARGKIVATTRDFEQPAGFTGEFTMRSYLVGEVHADWLDDDEGEDLVRTDRQSILWDSERGQALQKWGAEIIKKIAAASSKPRRERKSQLFMEQAKIKERATERYGDDSVVAVASNSERGSVPSRPRMSWPTPPMSTGWLNHSIDSATSSSRVRVQRNIRTARR